MRNIDLDFKFFSDAFSTPIFSFWFVSHSFRKSSRSDTLIQSIYQKIWQMTSMPMKKVKDVLVNYKASQKFNNQLFAWLSWMVPHLSDQLVSRPNWFSSNVKPCNSKRQNRMTMLDAWRTVLNADQLLPVFLRRASILEHLLLEEVGYNLSERIICQFWLQFTHLLGWQ